MDKEHLTRLIDQHMSQRQIAAELACSQANVKYWLGKYGLKTKKKPLREPCALRYASVGAVLPTPPAADEDSNRVSARTESRILAALTHAGYPCYVPFGVGKADLVIETSEGLKTIQIKTGSLIESSAAFKFKASSTDRKGRKRGYQGAIDYFAVATPGVPGTFLIPVDDVGDTEIHLRLAPSRNNQVSRVRLAEHYLLPGSDLTV